MERTVISSPLNSQVKATLIKTVRVSRLVKLYKEFGIDVAPYFKDLKEISVYECQQTKYRFYHPNNLGGDSVFYEHFQKFDWYYMPWKWEHEVTTQYLKNGDRILEVGCAHGAFLKRINELYNLEESIGLELNESTPHSDQNLKIVNQAIQHFQESHANEFDIVCSYQVLEHIADVYGFLEAKIACLKSGGTLIISVPNNESFIKNSEMCLNYPPHHMGLWDTHSLKALTEIFPIDLSEIHYEPLQDYHTGSYLFAKYYIKYPRTIGKIIMKFHKLIKVYNRRERMVLDQKKNLIGHTIMVTFRKK